MTNTQTILTQASQVDREKKDVELTNDQNDSRAPHPQHPHKVKQMHGLLIVQMQEIKGLCHVTRYSDIDSTYIPYLIVYPMMSSWCFCVYIRNTAAVH